MSEIENLAEGAGKLLGAVPELYDDLAKTSVQEAGKILVGKVFYFRAFYTLFYNLDYIIILKAELSRIKF